MNKRNTLSRPSETLRIEGFLQGFMWFGGSQNQKRAYAFITKKIVKGSGESAKTTYPRFCLEVNGKDAKFLEVVLNYNKANNLSNAFISINAKLNGYPRPTGKTKTVNGKTYNITEDRTYFDSWDAILINPSTREIIDSSSAFAMSQMTVN